MHLSGAADTAAFVTYIDQVLYPTLKPGDIVVMDNRAVQKSPEVNALVQAAGAEVQFLPADSPDLNPIEKMWSKIKSVLRSARGAHARATRSRHHHGLLKITAKDAAGHPAC